MKNIMMLVMLLLLVALTGLTTNAQETVYTGRVANIEKIKKEIKKQCNAKVLSRNQDKTILESVEIRGYQDISLVKHNVQKAIKNMDHLIIEVSSWHYSSKHDWHTLAIITSDENGTLFMLRVIYKQEYIFSLLLFPVTKIDINSITGPLLK
jgi:Na+-translocating ferredoxin:NAD+ oxidoreductase RnfG subunit